VRFVAVGRPNIDRPTILCHDSTCLFVHCAGSPRSHVERELRRPEYSRVNDDSSDMADCDEVVDAIWRSKFEWMQVTLGVMGSQLPIQGVRTLTRPVGEEESKPDHLDVISRHEETTLL